MKTSNKVFAKFVDAVSSLDGWEKTEDFLKICDEKGVFDGVPIEDMVANAKKSAIRRMIRQVHLIPGNHEQREWVSIHIMNADGETETAYKQLELFDVDDFVQVIKDRCQRVQSWKREVDRFFKLAKEKYGNRIDELFPMLVEEEEPAAA
jgi:hypothetical protein